MLKLTALLAAASLANAHFVLSYPPTIGFNDDKEDIGPCGGFTPDFATDNLTDFFVGGDNIATNLLHAQGTWLYRATLDETAGASANWTKLFPEVLQSGLGKFCQPSVTAPAAWAGKKGVLSVVVDAPDGLLYQCASVNFVAGAASASQDVCTNSSSVTAAFTTDANLASLTGDSSSTTASNTSTSTASPTSSTAAATSSVDSAAGRAAGSVVGVALAAVLGSVFML
ncbi:gpi anchored cell wall protein [Ophiostoma piceae UAMH 11346]|uniref:Gpi anchored cell wall protein n=1 Tax=Ophiostoma piceae (strain UAMH 11346) TaxID=1262450 RepID=S3BXZ0_OPHP1|nr:gpi anchored cell wall protein [Ophiostoma piceae UAMH 11346]